MTADELRLLYPDAQAIFGMQQQSVEAIKDTCLVVLDTSVLLLPYRKGKPDQLEQYKSIYKCLATAERLMVPGHVAREFAGNRSEKLRQLYSQVADNKQSVNTKVELPEEFSDEHQTLTELVEQIQELTRQHSKIVNDLLERIIGRQWNDPISTMYREIFTGSVVFDPGLDEEILQRDLERRRKHKIPPGYKDAGKETNADGDLRIWHTILRQVQRTQNDAIFVSEDMKPDWFVRSKNKPLAPHYELIYEFARASDGKTLHILKFSDFLKLYGARDDVVEEVRQEEYREEAKTISPASSPRSWQVAVIQEWLRGIHPGAQIKMQSPENVGDLVISMLDGTQLFVTVFDALDSSRAVERDIVATIGWVCGIGWPIENVWLFVVAGNQLGKTMLKHTLNTRLALTPSSMTTLGYFRMPQDCRIIYGYVEGGTFTIVP